MIKCLGEMNILSKYSSDIVPHFLRIFDREFEVDDKTEELENRDHSRLKIIAYCGLFSKTRKPRKLYQSQLLYNVFLQLSSNGDGKLQKLALDCLMTWQEPAIVQFKEQLYGLISDDAFRDSLSTFSMENIRETVTTEELPKLLKLSSYILFGKIISKKGRNSAKSGLAARRAAIFSFLATMTDLERKYLFDLIFEPFQSILKNCDQTKDFEIDHSAEMPPMKKQLGFLAVSLDFIKQLRTLIISTLPSLLETILHLIHFAEKDMKISATESFVISQLRDVRMNGVKRLTLLFSIDLDFDFGRYIGALFSSYIDGRIPKLCVENTQTPSALMELFSSWTKDIRYVKYLTHNAELIPQILLILSAKKAGEIVIVFILSMIENIQELEESDPHLDIIKSILGPHLQLLLEQFDFILSLRLDANKMRFNGQTIASRVIQVLARIDRRAHV